MMKFNMALFVTLFDWWRGDNGILPEGMDMPGVIEQEKARDEISRLPDPDVTYNVAEMLSRRWIVSEEDKTNFGIWLQGIIAEGRTAAALDLLEAGRNALTFLESLGYKGGDIHDDLRDAIIRAEGGTPPERD